MKAKQLAEPAIWREIFKGFQNYNVKINKN